MEIVLPWPDTILRVNNRAHWTKKLKAKQSHRDIGLYTAKANPYVFGDGNIPISIVFHPPTKRQHDLDNCLSQNKALLDGLASGWGINDKRFRPIQIDFGDPVKGGKVVVRVLTGEDNERN